MSVHASTLTLILAAAATYVGWQVGLREGDRRGLVGYALGLAVIVCGLTWQLGI